MYSCVFVKVLWKDENKKRQYKLLEKRLKLPFVPMLGLEVSDDNWFSGKVERIVWDSSCDAFTLKVVDLIPKEGVTAELLLEAVIKQGWRERKD